MLVGWFQTHIGYMNFNFPPIIIFQNGENATAWIPRCGTILQPDDDFPAMSNLFDFESRR